MGTRSKYWETFNRHPWQWALVALAPKKEEKWKLDLFTFRVSEYLRGSQAKHKAWRQAKTNVKDQGWRVRNAGKLSTWNESSMWHKAKKLEGCVRNFNDPTKRLSWNSFSLLHPHPVFAQLDCLLFLRIPTRLIHLLFVFPLVRSDYLISVCFSPSVPLHRIVCSLTSLQPSKPFSRTYLRRKIERITAVLVYFDIFAIQTHLFCADPLLMNGPQTTNKSRGLDFHTSDHQSNTFSTLARQQCCCHTLLQSVLTQQ